MSDSVWPHRRQPTRLPCPWDSPGKNTGVGSHFLLQCMKVKSGKWEVKLKSLSRVRPSATPWTAAFQAPPSMGFSRQEYWSGVPLPSLNSNLVALNSMDFSFPWRERDGANVVLVAPSVLSSYTWYFFFLLYHIYLWLHCLFSPVISWLQNGVWCYYNL